MKTIRSILKKKSKRIWSTEPDATVFEALQLMSEKDIGALPVLEGGKVVGIFSERDYARKVILKGRSSHETRVREIMSAPVICIDPDQANEYGLALMTAKHVRHLPVVEDGNLIGFISIGDLVKSIIEEQKIVIDKLEQHIVRTSGMY